MEKDVNDIERRVVDENLTQDAEVVVEVKGEWDFVGRVIDMEKTPPSSSWRVVILKVENEEDNCVASISTDGDVCLTESDEIKGTHMGMLDSLRRK